MTCRQSKIPSSSFCAWPISDSFSPSEMTGSLRNSITWAVLLLDLFSFYDIMEGVCVYFLTDFTFWCMLCSWHENSDPTQILTSLSVSLGIVVWQEEIWGLVISKDNFSLISLQLSNRIVTGVNEVNAHYIERKSRWTWTYWFICFPFVFCRIFGNTILLNWRGANLFINGSQKFQGQNIDVTTISIKQNFL